MLDNQYSSSLAVTIGGNGVSTTYAGSITNASKPGSIIKTGTGALTLSGNNSYTGGTTLSQGQLNVNSATALGTGTLTIAGGTTIDNTSGGVITLATNNAQNWNGDFTFAGTNPLNLGTGAVTLSANRTVTVGGSLTVGGVIGEREKSHQAGQRHADPHGQ